MPAFDPEQPANGSTLDAAVVRENLNALNDQNTATNERINQNDTADAATNARIDQTDASVANAHYRIDTLPPAFPWGSDAQIGGNTEIGGSLKTAGAVHAQGGVGVGVTDGGGSGETGVMLGIDASGGFPLQTVAIRNGGNTLFQIKQDFGGQLDGAGTPTIADGALYRYDASAGALKPWNVTIRTIQALDDQGNPITLQVICPPA